MFGCKLRSERRKIEGCCCEMMKESTKETKRTANWSVVGRRGAETGDGRRGEWGRRVRSRGEPAQSGFTVSSCKLYDCGISEAVAATRPPRVLLFSREERNYLRSVVINLACLESDMDFLIGNGSFPNFQVLFIFIA